GIQPCLLSKSSVGEWCFSDHAHRNLVELDIGVTDLRRHGDRRIDPILGSTPFAELDEDPFTNETLEDGSGDDAVDVEQFAYLAVGGTSVTSDLHEDQGRTGVELVVVDEPTYPGSFAGRHHAAEPKG